MSRRTLHVLALAACAPVLWSVGSGGAQAEYQPPTELYGQFGVATPLKNAAMIETTPGGYRYTAGQQNSHLTVSIQGNNVVYVDTGTQELRAHPSSCSQVSVSQGIKVECAIPSGYDGANRLYLEVWPRLGDDFVDGSTLPSWTRFWVLADRGHDTVYGGAGDDFVNGAQGGDRVYGGAGDDWLRTGKGSDKIWGGDGNDKLVGVYNDDEIHGGAGNDRVGGGPGNDKLYGDEGSDTVACGGGADNAWVDSSDHMSECESVTHG